VTGFVLLLFLFAADNPPNKPVEKPVETFQTAMQKQRAAMEIQRAAVRKQLELAAEWRGGASPEPSECDPLPEIELAPMIDAAAQANHLETKLLRGVIEQESAKRPCVVSPKGAIGLMQLMPATADQLDVDDPFDARQNVEAGAKYLKQLLDRYKGDVKLALAAYNAGPAAVDQKNGIPEIKETQNYVEAIIQKLK
jgi:soluble lytic murein transglycosylase-like protein